MMKKINKFGVLTVVLFLMLGCGFLQPTMDTMPTPVLNEKQETPTPEPGCEKGIIDAGWNAVGQNFLYETEVPMSDGTQITIPLVINIQPNGTAILHPTSPRGQQLFADVTLETLRQYSIDTVDLGPLLIKIECGQLWTQEDTRYFHRV